ncbi:hypothetical protein DFH06DRAFT_1139897 [Mycena polygramma]|nr:hypothetical protein DFH06DRAFT_1139897 [Mycena polygramma]
MLIIFDEKSFHSQHAYQWMGGDPACAVAPFNYLSVRGSIDCMHYACDSAGSRDYVLNFLPCPSGMLLSSSRTTSAGGSRSVRLGAARDVNVRVRASTRREFGSDGVHGAKGVWRFREETEHGGRILNVAMGRGQSSASVLFNAGRDVRKAEIARRVAQAGVGDCVAMGSCIVCSIRRAGTGTAMRGGQRSRAPASMPVTGADADASMQTRRCRRARGGCYAAALLFVAGDVRTTCTAVNKRPKAVTSSSPSWTATTPSCSPLTLAYPKWNHL